MHRPHQSIERRFDLRFGDECERLRHARANAVFSAGSAVAVVVASLIIVGLVLGSYPATAR